MFKYGGDNSVGDGGDRQVLVAATAVAATAEAATVVAATAVAATAATMIGRVMATIFWAT